MPELDDEPVYVRVSPDLVRQLKRDWSQAMMVKINDTKLDAKGISVLELEFRQLPNTIFDDD